MIRRLALPKHSTNPTEVDLDDFDSAGVFIARDWAGIANHINNTYTIVLSALLHSIKRWNVDIKCPERAGRWFEVFTLINKNFGHVERFLIHVFKLWVHELTHLQGEIGNEMHSDKTTCMFSSLVIDEVHEIAEWLNEN